MRSAARISCLIAVVLVAAAAAQTIPYVPGFNVANGLNAWRPSAANPTLTLVGNGDAPPVSVWLGETDAGLVVLGQIGTTVTYAADLGATPESNFVRLRLAATADAARPPQVPASSAWRKLFTRIWEVVPGQVRETEATPAYADMLRSVGAGDHAAFAGLQPQGTPRMLAGDENGNSSFLILIPWNAFPPAGQPDLSRIFLSVEFCPANEHCAVLTPGINLTADVTTWPSYTLERPKQTPITP